MSREPEFRDTSEREPHWQLHDAIQRVMDPDLVDDDALG